MSGASFSVDLTALLAWGCGAFMLVLSWLYNRQEARLKELDKRLREHDERFTTNAEKSRQAVRDDIRDLRTEMNARVDDLKKDTRDSLRELITKIDGIPRAYP